MAETTASHEFLRGLLTRGMSAEPDQAERAVLGIGPGDGDREFARALVARLAAASIAGVGLDPTVRRDPRTPREVAPIQSADSSLVGRLAASGEALASVEDLPTLLAVARGGSLRQRRAALRRLEALATHGALAGDAPRAVARLCGALRAEGTAYEVARVRDALPGAEGRRSRAERESRRREGEALAARIARFWDGELGEEPVLALPADVRAELALRLRDLGDLVAAHLGAIFEGNVAEVGPDARAELLAALRAAGDPRLVPSLAMALDDANPAVVTAAARALAHTEDPRVPALLVAAYERTVVDATRVVIAGALGATGDVRAREYVRHLTASDDLRLVRAAVDALGAVGAAEDTERLVAFLHADDLALVETAIRALGDVGDARALAALAARAEETDVSALWAELDCASAAIRARMELRGEEAAPSLAATRPRADLARRREPAWVRLLAAKDFLLGQLWRGLGLSTLAVRRFEAAARRRPGWAAPELATALVHHRRRQHALALGSFRRALDSDRARVERHPLLLSRVTECFLRRAEELEREGRLEIARGLVDEILTLDLGRAPSALRFELRRRQESLRARGGR